MFCKRNWFLLLALASAFMILSAPEALAVVAAPTNLIASASGSSVVLTWQDNANNESNYTVVRYDPASDTWPVLIILPVDSTTYTDTGLTAGTTYRYFVRAYQSLGITTDWSDPSNEASATPTGWTTTPLGTIPATPTDLNAVVFSQSSIELNWADNAHNEEGYRLERQLAGSGSWAVIATLGADISTYLDTGLSPATSYEYRVTAHNAVGESTCPIIVLATTLGSTGNPPAPVTVMQFFIGSNQYTINGVYQTMDATPVEAYNRLFLPVRYVVQPLGIVPQWDGVSKVTIQNSTMTIELWMDENIANVNGTPVFIDPDNTEVVPFSMPPGRIMIPLRFVSENLGCSAVWDPNPPESAIITYPAVP